MYTILATLGVLLLRRALADAALAHVVRDPRAYVGVLCYAASFTTFLASLRRFEVLTVFPLFSGLAYASIAITGALFLAESLTFSRATGIALVGAGIVLLVR